MGISTPSKYVTFKPSSSISRFNVHHSKCHVIWLVFSNNFREPSPILSNFNNLKQCAESTTFAHKGLISTRKSFKLVAKLVPKLNLVPMNHPSIRKECLDSAWKKPNSNRPRPMANLGPHGGRPQASMRLTQVHAGPGIFPITICHGASWTA